MFLCQLLLKLHGRFRACFSDTVKMSTRGPLLQSKLNKKLSFAVDFKENFMEDSEQGGGGRSPNTRIPRNFFPKHSCYGQWSAIFQGGYIAGEWSTILIHPDSREGGITQWATLNFSSGGEGGYIVWRWSAILSHPDSRGTLGYITQRSEICRV